MVTMTTWCFLLVSSTRLTVKGEWGEMLEYGSLSSSPFIPGFTFQGCCFLIFMQLMSVLCSLTVTNCNAERFSCCMRWIKIYPSCTCHTESSSTVSDARKTSLFARRVAKNTSSVFSQTTSFLSFTSSASVLQSFVCSGLILIWFSLLPYLLLLQVIIRFKPSITLIRQDQ